jgi:hypothetical protein
MLRRIALGCAFAAGLVLAGLGGVASADISPVEGQPFSGTVGDLGADCPLPSGPFTINWGDGTTSPGTSVGVTGVQGTHTYADERSTTGTVTYTCSSGSKTTDFRVTVRDAPLTAAARTIAGTAATGLTGVVAHFIDANPAAEAAELSAQIRWGDGTSAIGVVRASQGGGFDVSGTHTYATSGRFSVDVSVADVGGSTTAVSSSAQIGATSSRERKPAFLSFSLGTPTFVPAALPPTVWPTGVSTKSGTEVRFRLTASATVNFMVDECLAKPRNARARCYRPSRVGEFSVLASRGLNTPRFTGYITAVWHSRVHRSGFLR